MDLVELELVRHLYPSIIEKVFAQLKFGATSTATTKNTTSVFKPSIFISREPGSGGRPVAEMVAQKLGFELFDEKLVEAVSKSAKLRKDLVRSVDEKHRGVIVDIVQSLLNPDYVSDMTYIRHVVKVILARAQKGKVVILGRGGNFIVPPERSLRVRIQAPYKNRVAWAIQFEHIDIDQAKENIAKADEERKQFVRQYFNKNVSNANYYDLVINTANMKLVDARDLIVFAFKRKFGIK